MKKKDFLVLAHLRRNARAPLTSISRKTGLAVSTLFDRIRNYADAAGLRNSSLFSFKSLGFNTTAHILLRADKGRKDDLVEHLDKCWFVNSLYRINNGWDVMCECVFSDMCAAEEFVESLELEFGVVQKEIHYVLGEVKRESFLSDPSTAEYIYNELKR